MYSDVKNWLTSAVLPTLFDPKKQMRNLSHSSSSPSSSPSWSSTLSISSILGSPEDLLLLTEDGPVLGKLNDVENPGEHGEIVRGERSRLWLWLA